MLHISLLCPLRSMICERRDKKDTEDFAKMEDSGIVQPNQCLSKWENNEVGKNKLKSISANDTKKWNSHIKKNWSDCILLAWAHIASSQAKKTNKQSKKRLADMTLDFAIVLVIGSISVGRDYIILNLYLQFNKIKYRHNLLL